MRLEGTLDAFSLPDIFQLLSFTKKTGTLHLRRSADGADRHGVVHLRDGAVTGGRGNASSQALGRRMVGAGLVSDQDLADTVAMLVAEPGSGLGKALADHGSIASDDAKRLAAEQATDAVFELLRWENGEFAFVVDESDPDDVGAALEVEAIIAEGRRRVDTWSSLVEKVPSTTAPVTIAGTPGDDPLLNKDEWALLSLVDGSRTVADLVTLSGTGEYVVVSALAALADRGLVHVSERAEGTDPLLERQRLLASLEGGPVPVAKPKAEAKHVEPAPAVHEPVVEELVVDEPVVEEPVVIEDALEDVLEDVVEEPERKPVIPERPEPFTPERQPDFAEEPVPALSRISAAIAAPHAPVPAAATASVSSSSSHGSVQGAHALQPESAPAVAPVPSGLIDRDPSVNKSLLLRLIAGVRGL